VGEGESGVPFGGEGRVARAALGISRAMDPEFARGAASVAGAAQGGEKPLVLERLAAVEGARHGVALANEILHFKRYSASKSINPTRCDCSRNAIPAHHNRGCVADRHLSGP
jgi:hypothetical protein